MNRMKFIIATKNAHKVEEFQRILEPLGITAVSQEEAGLDISPEENADTFEGNSLLKAKAVQQAAGVPVIADDSGLEVYALGNAPGVYSARYGGPGLSDGQRTEKLLGEMRKIPDLQRGARFVSCISLVLNGEKLYTFTGICEGKIGHEPLGSNGFGYDPVFMVGEKSFAQLSGKEKDAISHRGKALRKMAEKLPVILAENGIGE